MKKLVIAGLPLILLFLFMTNANAVPGDYSLRFKIGPSFAMVDYEHQVKLGGAFDYDLGYGWGIGFETFIGIKNNFLFQMMPNIRFTWLYIGPAELFFFGGLGFEIFDKDAAMGMRFGGGVVLPLGSQWEVISDVSMNITPAGTPGTPTTLDWLLGMGYRFGGGR